MLWNSIPSQLAKENKKFIYGLVREGARAKDYETAIMWLCEPDRARIDIEKAAKTQEIIYWLFPSLHFIINCNTETPFSTYKTIFQ